MGILSGRTAIVTGAASGIGRAIALRLGKEGAWIAVVDLDENGARAVVKEIESGGGSGGAFKADVTDFGAVQGCVQQIETARGAVDVLVNNAGWDLILPFSEMTEDFWNKVIAINYKGPVHFSRAVVDGMIRNKKGKIISISSDAGRVGSSGESVYAGCKAAIIGLSKTLARELARHQITVNVVCPGPTDTPFLKRVTGGEMGAKVIDAMIKATPLRRLAKPEDIAGAVVYFASPDADFVTGQVLSVSGGLTMAG
ncbi:MAG: glucose 1-dehydrogenase [Nitrospirae bacterium]|nr:glucose 1-dehydrogenase [Nitrospirota bacterium]